jgi:plasmid stability protein
VAVATLYVRNIPADLYEQLQTWAAEDDRSVNAEVIDLLRAEAERRDEETAFDRLYDAYHRAYGGKRTEGPPWASDVVVAERRRGHKPELGY